MRVVILAIDGLEYDLVEKWRLKGLMRRRYGAHDVRSAVKPGDPLYTPLIWAAFLLGEPAYKYGFDHKALESQKAGAGYRGPLRLLFKLRLKLLGKRQLGIRRTLARLGLYDVKHVAQVLEKIEALPPRVAEKTFVAEAERRGLRVWRTSFPGLPGDMFSKYRAELWVYFEADFEERARKLEEIKEVTARLFEEMLENASNADLVLYYTPLIDDAHHLIYRPGNLKAMARLRAYYSFIEKLVVRADRELGGDSAILVVSDHGYDPRIHDHSDHGFWSLNIEPPREPRSILDFRGIIEHFLYNE